MIDWDKIDNAERWDLHDWVVNIGEMTLDKLARIRLGVYSEEQDGSVQEILEEIERILR